MIQMKKIVLLAILLLTVVLPSIAQTLRGRVVDSRTQDPIIGAVLSVKGTSSSQVGSVTDADGRFTLNVKKTPAIVVVSYAGYKKEEIDIFEITDDELPISLTEDFNALQGVVVVGYGTQKKSDLVGSVTSVSVSDLNKNVNSSLNNLLDGTASGLQVSPSSGQPGAGVSLRIRGASSVQGGSEPLYVIDGFPIYNESFSPSLNKRINAYGASEKTDILSSINPGDIESITILKDASATAIYGSRGANGVILITTKHGRAGEKAQVSYSGSIGVQSLRKKIDVLNAQEFASLRNDALYDTNPNLGRYQYKTQAEIETLDGTDWQDEAYRDAIVTNHQLSVNGGTEKLQYALSGNYYKQDGILQNTGFDRISFRSNINSHVTKRLTISANITGSKTNTEIPPIGVVYSILQVPSTVPVYNEDGKGYNYNSEFETELKNPIASLNESKHSQESYKFLGTTFAEYEFIKNLKLKVLFGVNIDNIRENNYVPSTLYEDYGAGGTAAIGFVSRESWLNENTLNYATTLFNKHNLSFLVGFTQQSTKQNTTTTGSSNFISDFFQYNSLEGGSVLTNPTSSSIENALISVLGRINYDYDNRHYLSVSLRRDGSSRFGKDNKWGTFPSLGYSWNVSNERFFKPLKSLLSNLKVRLSYGVTGNQEIGNYQSLSTLYANKYVIGDQVLVGYAPDRIANNELGWETTKQYDFGIDFSLFHDRLNFTTDYYYKKTTDLLLSVEIPYTSGFKTSLQNYGSLRNQGFEFGVTSKNFVGKFKWSTSANISFNRNEILSLGDGNESFISGSYILKVGQPLGSFYGAVSDGVLQKGEESSKGAYTYNQSAKPGDRLYKDIDGDKVFTNANDRTIIGNAEPDFTFGITNNFEYDNWDLSFLITGSMGNDIINNNRQQLALYTGKQNSTGEARNRWTDSNPSATVSRAKSDPAAIFSSEFVENGSFVRLKSITLGYTLPKKVVNYLKVSNVHLYASATNLLTLTDYTGYDPEISSSSTAYALGIDRGAYPTTKTYNFGIDINF